MERRANVYRSNGVVVITSVIRTTMGVGLDADPIVLGGRPDASAIAAALSRALENSLRVVPHPAQNEWKRVANHLPRAVGVRSQKAFMQDAEMVSVSDTDSTMRLARWVNKGRFFEPDQRGETTLAGNDLAAASETLGRMMASEEP